jgi:hypothetical protein
VVALVAAGLALATLAACHQTSPPTALASGTSGPGLVVRTSLRPYGWSIKIPETWQRAGPCTNQSAGLCSTVAGDTDIEVWHDPTNTGRRVTIVTCRGGGCAATRPTGGPVFPPAVQGAAVTTLQGPGKLAFTLGPGTHPVGPYRIDGVVVTNMAGVAPSFPVFTVMTSLPDSVHWLATDILSSFTTSSSGGS